MKEGVVLGVVLGVVNRCGSLFDAIAITPYFLTYYDYKGVMAEEQGDYEIC